MKKTKRQTLVSWFFERLSLGHIFFALVVSFVALSLWLGWISACLVFASLGVFVFGLFLMTLIGIFSASFVSVLCEEWKETRSVKKQSSSKK